MDEVPENWQDMTIVDGVLVPASAEAIAAREVTRGIAETESKRQTKEVRFKTETDKKLFEAIETFAVAHPEFPEFEAWLSAKNAIRTEVENPTPPQGVEESV